tara:strand:+ start:1437 stop:1811 length:375 start_codon:yes stop_codon:yes gene_type:complete
MSKIEFPAALKIAWVDEKVSALEEGMRLHPSHLRLKESAAPWGCRISEILPYGTSNHSVTIDGTYHIDSGDGFLSHAHKYPFLAMGELPVFDKMDTVKVMAKVGYVDGDEDRPVHMVVNKLNKP